MCIFLNYTKMCCMFKRHMISKRHLKIENITGKINDTDF